MRLSAVKLYELEKSINEKLHALQLEVVIAKIDEVVEDDDTKLICVIRVSNDEEVCAV